MIKAFLHLEETRHEEQWQNDLAKELNIILARVEEHKTTGDEHFVNAINSVVDRVVDFEDLHYEHEFKPETKRHKKEKEEYVLCVPRATLFGRSEFQGFTSAVCKYEHLIWGENTNFEQRTSAENRPSWKQIIPYIIWCRDGKVFRYRRGKKGGENRLHDLWSIGIGGHINPTDKTYDDAIIREFFEETGVRLTHVPPIIGYVNDDSTEVGRVHFGVVHVVYSDRHIASHDAATAESGVIEKGEFVTLGELTDASFLPKYESWSKSCMDKIASVLMADRK